SFADYAFITAGNWLTPLTASHSAEQSIIFFITGYLLEKSFADYAFITAGNWLTPLTASHSAEQSIIFFITG
ncbi:hypothetical protein GJ26_18960, partial [Vibrio cholerae]